MLLWFLPIAAAVFGAAILRGLTGFGFALAAVPLMSLIIEPRMAVASTILLQVMIGFHDLLHLHGSYDRATVLRLSLGSMLGMPFGIAALALFDPDAGRLAIAAISLAGLGMMLRQPQRRVAPGPGVTLAAGVLSGLFGSLAAMPGPPTVAYFVASGTPVARARASMMIFFFVSALITLPGLAVAGAVDLAALGLSLALLPLLVSGTWVGGRLFLRLEARHYRGLALGVMALAAGLAGARALVGML
ncbi:MULTISPECIES: sulfite exporter TauE/SafE family protein [Paracoccus]|jgi:uncharacterized membrane protein YfcA|uniref:sulfite exporter TauE/SafE family protein n=1 Tax=Paracoccus TaxID=265 RepID=UPI00258725CF|nr:sulfite exporter TauE/SafE family protein [Paracoccus sp. (in: a-proteobacteria)]